MRLRSFKRKLYIPDIAATWQYLHTPICVFRCLKQYSCKIMQVSAPNPREYVRLPVLAGLLTCFRSERLPVVLLTVAGEWFKTYK